METIGFVAGTLVAVSLLPQVVKSWKTKSTRDIAWSWTLINFLGQILWIVYGVGVESSSLVIMSSITLFLATLILILKVRNG